MIIDFEVNFKCYNEKILNNYSLKFYVCPTCGAKHSLARHGSYKRNICYLDNDNFIEDKISILRLKCSSCNRTHAILPSDIVPYCIYSFSFMINVLSNHFCEKATVASTCQSFYISFQVLYKFISRLLHFIDSIIVVLRELGIYSQDNKEKILKCIEKIKTLKNFSQLYFSSLKWICFMKKFHNILSKPISIGTFYKYIQQPT